MNKIAIKQMRQYFARKNKQKNIKNTKYERNETIVPVMLLCH